MTGIWIPKKIFVKIYYICDNFLHTPSPLTYSLYHVTLNNDTLSRANTPKSRTARSSRFKRLRAIPPISFVKYKAIPWQLWVPKTHFTFRVHEGHPVCNLSGKCKTREKIANAYLHAKEEFQCFRDRIGFGKYLSIECISVNFSF